MGVNLYVHHFGDASWTLIPLRSDAQAWSKISRPITALNCQGVLFEGFDSYHAAFTDDGLDGVVVWAWNREQAHSWTFYPLAKDSRLNQAINTFQFAESRYGADRLTFQPPTLSPKPGQRESIVLPVIGWREFCEHLPASEVEEGRVKEQRAQGRYEKPLGTRTYFQSSSDRADGSVVASNEDALLVAADGSASETLNVDMLSVAMGWSFSTAGREPYSPDWPSGDYRCQLDATAAGADIRYAVRTVTVGVNSVVGGFARVDGGVEEELNQALDGPFSGTGLKLSTFGADAASWGAGSRTDVFATRVAVGNNGLATQSLTLELGTSDSFADGPWLPKQALAPLMLQGVGY